jgi:hypothetical protein
MAGQPIGALGTQPAVVELADVAGPPPPAATSRHGRRRLRPFQAGVSRRGLLVVGPTTGDQPGERASVAGLDHRAWAAAARTRRHRHHHPLRAALDELATPCAVTGGSARDRP